MIESIEEIADATVRVCKYDSWVVDTKDSITTTSKYYMSLLDDQLRSDSFEMRARAHTLTVAMSIYVICWKGWIYQVYVFKQC